MTETDHLAALRQKFGDKIVDDLVRVAEAHRQRVYSDPMRPPWQVYPDIARHSIGWRMGGGEDYMIDFARWFRAQDQTAQRNYRRHHAAPEG